MRHHIQFNDLQRAADTLRTVAQAMKQGNVAQGNVAPGSRIWSVAYNPTNDGVEIFASCDSKAMVVFSGGELVFVTDSAGAVCRFYPGAWIDSANALFHDAVTAGYIAPLGIPCRSLSQAELEAFCPEFTDVACPWLDAIEAAKEPWELMD